MYTYSSSFMRDLLLKEEPRSFFIKRYPTIVGNYFLLSEKIGINCPNALLLLKMLWISENNKDEKAWQQRLANNDWQ